MTTLTNEERKLIREIAAKLFREELERAFQFVNANPHLVFLYFNQHKEPFDGRNSS